MIDARSDQERCADRDGQHGVALRPKTLTKRQIEWRKRFGHLVNPRLITPAVRKAGGY